MDVRLSIRWALFLTFLPLFISCGNRLDADTAHGRQAIIDETNQYLSKGNCSGAHSSIDKLYFSRYINEEVVILKASAYACAGSFSLMSLIANLSAPVSQIPNFYAALAHTIPGTGSDGRLQAMYGAVDILTGGGTLLSAAQRSSTRNNYMIFLQLGVFGAVLSAYGSPNATTGAQGAALVYATMPAADSCALVVSIATVVDSLANSTLSSDPNILSAASTFNTLCATLGGACSLLAKDRSACTGVESSALVTEINNGW